MIRMTDGMPHCYITSRIRPTRRQDLLSFVDSFIALDAPAYAEGGSEGRSGGGKPCFVSLAFVGEAGSEGGSCGKATHRPYCGADDFARVGGFQFGAYRGDFGAGDGEFGLFGLDGDGVSCGVD